MCFWFVQISIDWPNFAAWLPGPAWCNCYLVFLSASCCVTFFFEKKWNKFVFRLCRKFCRFCFAQTYNLHSLSPHLDSHLLLSNLPLLVLAWPSMMIHSMIQRRRHSPSLSYFSLSSFSDSFPLFLFFPFYSRPAFEIFPLLFSRSLVSWLATIHTLLDAYSLIWLSLGSFSLIFIVCPWFTF